MIISIIIIRMTYNIDNRYLKRLQTAWRYYIVVALAVALCPQARALEHACTDVSAAHCHGRVSVK